MSKKWDGLCLAGKHGLDYEGQACDLCCITVKQNFTRAEMLAFGERVREACAAILERKRDSDDRRYGGNDPAYNAMTDASEVVRAVDVARLLDSGD